MVLGKVSVDFLLKGAVVVGAPVKEVSVAIVVEVDVAEVDVDVGAVASHQRLQYTSQLTLPLHGIRSADSP